MRKEKSFWLFSRLWCLPRALLPVTVIILGMTLLLLPVNAQQSNNSGEHLQTWTLLSGKFERTLNEHEQTLNELSVRLRTSEVNGERLTGLSEELLRQNEDLKNYNQQIGERMQERDEDLAAAYTEIEVMKKQVSWLFLICVIAGGLFLLTMIRPGR